jgi:hypothetical protein
VWDDLGEADLAGASMKRNQGALVALGCGVVAVIAAALPWVEADAGFVSASKNGLDGDGQFTAVLGLVVAVFAWLARAGRSRRDWFIVIASALITAIAIYDIADVNSVQDDLGIIQVGIGLWLTAVAGALGVVTGIVLLRLRTSPAGQVVASAPTPPPLTAQFGQPAWIADPTGRHEYRYWDGAAWTDQVSDKGAVARDPVQGPPTA